MKNLFAYSDEAGNYCGSSVRKVKDPFYLRCTYTINSSELKKLCKYDKERRLYYNIPFGEIKWAYLYPLRQAQQKEQLINYKKEYYFLSSTPCEDVLSYVQDLIEYMTGLDGFKVIVTLTNNQQKWYKGFSYEEMLGNHHQYLVQRLEKDLGGGMVTLFVDEIDRERNKYISEYHNRLISKGDRYNSTYISINECLNINCSEHSLGVRIADYICGVVNNYLKRACCSYNVDYSTRIFRKSIYPYLRRSSGNKIMGYGIIDFPRSEKFREQLNEYIEEDIQQNCHSIKTI